MEIDNPCCGTIITDFCDKSFEDYILSIIPSRVRQNDHRNVVLRYGSNKPYPNKIVSSIIPKEFDFIKEAGYDFDSVTINQYLRRQFIEWHIDKGENPIVIISLLSDNFINFRNGPEAMKVLLPRYSLFQMSSELRMVWQHHVLATQDRISVVLRKSNEVSNTKS